MVEDRWLLGVYYGGFVTASEKALKEFDLAKDNAISPFFEYHFAREKVRPYFFFLCAVKDAEPVIRFDSSDYGVRSFAYKSFEGIRLAAKGFVEGGSFVVCDVPGHILQKCIGLDEHLCALVLVDTVENLARTGTFFRYEIKRSKGSNDLRFTPLEYGGKYLAGKGILRDAYLRFESQLGVMDGDEYERERVCPLTVGSSVFKIGKSGHYIAYRAVKTDLRLDMPFVFLYLSKVGGFKRIARNMAKTMNFVFGEYIDHMMSKRNILADGNIIDYDGINYNEGGMLFDIRNDKEKVENLVEGLFVLFYICAVAADYPLKGLQHIINAKDEEGKRKLRDFDQRNFENIHKRYKALCSEFMKSLEPGLRAYFASLYDIRSLFESALSRKPEKTRPQKYDIFK